MPVQMGNVFHPPDKNDQIVLHCSAFSLYRAHSSEQDDTNSSFTLLLDKAFVWRKHDFLVLQQNVCQLSSLPLRQSHQVNINLSLGQDPGTQTHKLTVVISVVLDFRHNTQMDMLRTHLNL